MRKYLTLQNARFLFTALLLIGLLGIPSQSARAYTLHVNSFYDEDDGTCDAVSCSLREAINFANATPGYDEIWLQPGSYELLDQELLITDAIHITGAGSDQTVIHAAPNQRVFNITNSDVFLTGLTLTGGSTNFGGAIYCKTGNLALNYTNITNNNATVAGGGILLWDCTATLTRSTVSNNNSAIDGGGIFSFRDNPAVRSLTVSESVVINNTSFHNGGGIYAENFIVYIFDSQLEHNTGQNGGGLYYASEDGHLELEETLFSRNVATSNGGGLNLVFNDPVYAAIKNSTFSQNSANGAGGGIRAQGYTALTNTTFAENVADVDANESAFQGGGLSILNGPLIIANTLLGNNYENNNAADKSDCMFFGSGVFSSFGYNLAEAPGNCLLTSTGDLTNLDPLLGPLQDNGGPTHTHALLPESPALNAGDPGFYSPPFFDQRGVGHPRVLYGRLDIGAFEAGHVLYFPFVRLP